MKRLLCTLCVYITLLPAQGQFLSNLKATRDDALYTTYGAPIERSRYKLDQGYELKWCDPEASVEFISKDGPNIGVAFMANNELKFQSSTYAQAPMITTSYSDIVTLNYYPEKKLNVELTFDVYSSSELIMEVKVTNEDVVQKEVSILPYLYLSSESMLNEFAHIDGSSTYAFPLQKKRDGWMVEHMIPFVEQIRGTCSSDIHFDSVQTFVYSRNNSDNQPKDRFNQFKSSFILSKPNASRLNGLIAFKTQRIYPGETTKVRVVIQLQEVNSNTKKQPTEVDHLFGVNLKQIIQEDEKRYAHIPSLLSTVLPPSFDSTAHALCYRDLQYIYYSSFNLMQQCMMPPEGECRENYYVFSREPKWGWGYGGQVFHESLTMFAYSLMNPTGAMNSQRVYMQRQRSDGYINYRTGPYLNETIDFLNKSTTSAPWFNYENLEIYTLSNDKKFLQEAFESGKKFYQFYTAHRDSNNNGIYEWGAEAELESVRDARVAVWDQVAWPSNFEGPDVNSMLVMEAKSLSQMAAILQLPAEKERWSKEAKRLTALVNKYLWDSVSGFYYNVNKWSQAFTFHGTDDLKRKEIIGFLPLWAGISSKEQAQKLVENMVNPEQFWRAYGIPSLSANDAYYNPMGYWNGPVWVEWNYLLFRGLLDYGYKQEASELAFRVLNNINYHLKKDHVFWEFYSPDDREAGWNKTYIWAGLSACFIYDLQNLSR